jgi:hypothetical protein
LARAPPSPVTTSSVIAGPLRPFEQAGSAAILIVLAFGPAPSSFTDPVTSPAVAGSTDFPAGALDAGAELSVDSCLLPPQPVIAMANAPTASEYIPNLVFFTKRFLLFLLRPANNLRTHPDTESRVFTPESKILLPCTT